MNIWAAIAAVAGLTGAAVVALMTEPEDITLRAFVGVVGFGLFAFGVLHL